MSKKTRGLGRIYQPTYKDRATGDRKTTATFWIEYYAFDPKLNRSRKYRENANTTTKADALKFLQTRNGQKAKSGGVIIAPDAQKIRFSDLKNLLLTDYTMNGSRSLKRATIACAHLEHVFGSLRALEITSERVDHYITDRLTTVKPATVMNEIARLKRMFSLAIKSGRLDPSQRPYIRSLKIQNARQGFFEREQFEMLLPHLPAHVRPIVTFEYFTGWRGPSEVFGLTWPQVDFHAGEVRLEPNTTKNADGRTFPFAAEPALLALLTQQRQRVTAIEHATGSIIPWVFCRDDGSRIQDIRKPWHTACTKAGLAGRIPHDFRRTAVRNLERAGVPQSHAMKLTGHKTSAVYLRYAIVSKTDLAEAVAKLATLHAHDAQQPKKVISLAAAAGTGKVFAKMGKVT